MPLYEFYCPKCLTTYEYKMTLETHDKTKDFLLCDDCKIKLIQSVSPLKFKLNGNGWFGKSDTCVDPYGITDMETSKNLEHEQRVEGYANEMSIRETNVKEI